MKTRISDLIIVPRFFALDSSQLGEIARDATVPHLRKPAFELLDELAMNGWFLVLSWHHITELIQHGDVHLVEDRLRFIRRLPAVAWIRSYLPGRDIGAITDIFAHEVGAVLTRDGNDCIKVARTVRSNVFQVGTGEQALDSYEDIWDRLREMVRDRQERKREIASLSRFGAVDDAAEPLRPLLEGHLRSPEAAAATFEKLAQILTKNLTVHGDKKIPDPARTAVTFMSEIAAEGTKLYDQSENPIAAYLRQYDIDISQLDPDGPRRQLYDLMEFCQKLRVLNGQMRVPWGELVQTNPDLIPSWQIQRACRLHRAPATRAKGSDIDDMHIACIAPYCDATYVDNRTYETFRRTKRKVFIVQSLAQSIRKAASYQHAIRDILHGDPTA